MVQTGTFRSITHSGAAAGGHSAAGPAAGSTSTAAIAPGTAATTATAGTFTSVTHSEATTGGNNAAGPGQNNHGLTSHRQEKPAVLMEKIIVIKACHIQNSS